MNPRPLSRRTVLGSSLVAAAGLAGISLQGPRARAATPIIGCDAWGAAAPTEPVTVLATKPNKVIVHHTSTANTTDYSEAHAIALARSIQSSHFARDFIDSGQHFTITRGGFVLEGRHRSLETMLAGTGHVVGAHCAGQNSQAIGIENEGTYLTTAPPAALYSRLVSLCADLCQHYGISPTEIYGHRQFGITDCPGYQQYTRLHQLRSDVAAALGTPLDAGHWLPLSLDAIGDSVVTAQRLLRYHGYDVSADGQFGPLTQTAVTSFQSAHDQAASGTIGTDTWAALIVTTQRDAAGEQVKAIQEQLNARGYALGVDGDFGGLTETAVRAFQTASGFTSDGVVGPMTWRELVW